VSESVGATTHEERRLTETGRLLALAASLRPEVDVARLRCAPIAHTRNSRVYELSCGAALHWAAKVCVNPSTNALRPEAARIQFDALTKLRDHARAACVDLGKPNPIHLDEAAALVVMTWVEGESLTATLRRWPRAEATLDDDAMMAGQWLARLHAVGPRSDRTLATDRKLAGLADVLRLNTARDSAFRRGVALLERRAADAAAAPHVASWVHGDFKPDNMLLAAGRAAGIDMHLRDVGSVFEDIAPFLNNVEIQCALPRAWRRATRRAALVSRFLAGYTAELGAQPFLPLAWMRLYSALSLWAYDMAVRRSSVKAAIAQQVYRRLVGRLARALATTRADAFTA
jgi:aminoglycoside phosphotransferase (APT) family kinase protein